MRKEKWTGIGTMQIMPGVKKRTAARPQLRATAVQSVVGGGPPGVRSMVFDAVGPHEMSKATYAERSGRHLQGDVEPQLLLEGPAGATCRDDAALLEELEVGRNKHHH